MSKTLSEIYKTIQDDKQKIIDDRKIVERKLYEENLKQREYYFDTYIKHEYYTICGGGRSNTNINNNYIDDYVNNYFL